MDSRNDISEDLERRINQLTARSSLTRGQIIEDALARGRSLAWHERWIAGVREGIAEADRGEFASDDDIAAALGKYGPT